MITVIGNLKGGSGKSTVTFNLAGWLAVHGERVVAFDLDPQATLTDVSEVRREEGYQPVVEVRPLHDNVAAGLLREEAEVLVEALQDIAASRYTGTYQQDTASGEYQLKDWHPNYGEFFTL